MGHLVIEKILKGLYAKNNPDNPIAPKIHNLILLSQKADLEVPTEIREKIQTNISARYDDFEDIYDCMAVLMGMTWDIDARIEPHPIKREDFEKVSNPFVKEIVDTGIKVA